MAGLLQKRQISSFINIGKYIQQVPSLPIHLKINNNISVKLTSPPQKGEPNNRKMNRYSKNR